MVITINFLSSTVITLLASNETPPVKESQKERMMHVLPVVVVSALALFLLVMGIICWKCYFRDKFRSEQGTLKSNIWTLINGPRDLMTVASGGGVRAPEPKLQNDAEGLDFPKGTFSLKQIRAATDDFDASNKIGEGGFGPVYKGQLPDGTVIAVKQLSSKSRQGNREFLNEMGIISCLNHPNLVKLHGCCVESDQLLLVYEYMENNSLARALFGHEINKPNLDWPTRLKICIGIAKGLAFLHEESRFKIVHRDIKATNVLLDGDLNPKISDFGLARLDEEEKSHISTRVAGTIGYMAPEYALWGHLTYKADVYSFGVVALEIVSGKNNNNYLPSNRNCVCLIDWACHLQQSGSFMELVDEMLRSEINIKEAEIMVKVALMCTNASPTLRPAMSEAVSMLEGRMVVPETVPVLLYSDDLRFRALREHRQHEQRHSSSGSQKQGSNTIQMFGSSSTSLEISSEP